MLNKKKALSSENRIEKVNRRRGKMQSFLLLPQLDVY